MPAVTSVERMARGGKARLPKNATTTRLQNARFTVDSPVRLGLLDRPRKTEIGVQTILISKLAIAAHAIVAPSCSNYRHNGREGSEPRVTGLDSFVSVRYVPAAKT